MTSTAATSTCARRSSARREVPADEQTKRKLLAEQQAMKIEVNATCYGIFVELNVQERAEQAEVTFYGSDGMGTEVHLASVEEEGRYFHPLIATLTTGGARLMLGMAEALAEREGISWALCDTDSMALACPVEMEQAEFIARTRRVLDWFEPLKPYRVSDPLFKLEDANFAIDEQGNLAERLEPLYCYAVSAKRYCLFNLIDGRPSCARPPPTDWAICYPLRAGRGTGFDPAPIVSEKDLCVSRWQHDIWYRIVLAALEGHPDQVDLSDIPQLERKAISRYAATTPTCCAGSIASTRESPTRRRSGRSASCLRSTPRKPSGPPGQRQEDRAGGRRRAGSGGAVSKDPEWAARHAFDRMTQQAVRPEQLMSYREALAQYHLHPEAKFGNGDYTDRGTTVRRLVRPLGPIDQIGKEANKWGGAVLPGSEPGGAGGLRAVRPAGGARLSREVAEVHPRVWACGRWHGRAGFPWGWFHSSPKARHL